MGTIVCVVLAGSLALPQDGTASRPSNSGRAQNPARVKTKDLIGRPVPAFKMVTSSGQTVTDESLKGSLTVLVFTVSVSRHSDRAMRELASMTGDLQAHGVRVINVPVNLPVVNKKSKEENFEWFAGYQIPGEAAWDEDAALFSALKIGSAPKMIILGRDGTVEQVFKVEPDLPSMMKKELAILADPEATAKRAAERAKAREVGAKPELEGLSTAALTAPAWPVDSSGKMKGLEITEAERRGRTLFEELKRRLDALPNRAQREAAVKKGSDGGPESTR